jgi:hypothetical protein
MRIVFFVFLFLISSSKAFSRSEVGQYSPYIQVFSKDAQMLASQVENPYLSIKSEEIRYFPTGRQFDRLTNAFLIVEAVVNSQAFKEKVIGYINGRGKRQYQSNNKLTNEQIYLKLMEGRELLTPETPGVANMYVSKYYENSRTVGHTYPGSRKWIYVNWNFYSWYEVPAMAENLFHEWVHVMGFYHSRRNDYDSVPYAIGRIVGELAAKYQKEGFLD